MEEFGIKMNVRRASRYFSSFAVFLCCLPIVHIMSFGRGGWNSFRGKELSGKQSLMLCRLSRALSLFQLFLVEVRLVGVAFNNNYYVS